jgi:hypothetical protein
VSAVSIRLTHHRRRASLAAAATLLMIAAAGQALAAEVGAVKISTGAVHIERAGQRLPAPVGARIHASDVVVTGRDGSVGITFADNSLLSAGPDTVLVVDRFAFDPTTHAGAFETTLRRGTLAVVSGKIARQAPEAMKVRTPAAVLGVRGTDFLARTVEHRR